ncbi:glycosyltransferase [Arthrobacter sp. H5]|uniref:glycosyltransferase family protein n=1 Tax=Arthrobacter sp. H5 TaxID=1267973 RepID=UPI0004844158|nr:glycosyltransferase [Arthrobacter sp. H5]
MSPTPALISNLRRSIWHLRKGGLRQLRVFSTRRQAELGMRRLENVHGAQGGWARRGRNRTLQFTPAKPVAREPRRTDLTVAVILDDFSTLAFQYEWNTIALTRHSWMEQLQENAVDFLFVESAWSGNQAQWKYQLTGTSGPKQDFLDLMAWCNQHAIPTVLWNKEDPPHYNDFLPAARKFDVVFTSDSNKIVDYIEALGHERVYALPFAAQPAIHNPVRPRFGFRERDIAFAGMYFANKYPERREQLDIVLGGALDVNSRMETGLEIFSRQLGGEERYQFPDQYNGHVVGSLSYEQMLTAYKAYKVFLNVNSVVDSPSMCARRIFEITAAGGSVLSTPSEAIRNFFTGDELVCVSEREEASHMALALIRNSELADRLVHKAQRTIWSHHTYAHRAETVVGSVLGHRAQPVAKPAISALVSTIRPHQLEHVFRTFGSQMDVEAELVLLTHGFTPKRTTIDTLAEQFGVGNFVLLTADREVSLGECLNRCVAVAGGQVVTKMDDDDFYGPNYLSDQLHALNYSGATIVGKQAHYMYLESKDATMLRFAHREHRFTRMVMGPTLMGDRSVFTQYPFKAVMTGEDTRFLQTVSAAGGSVYSSDRFNYFQYRKDSGHTWDVETEKLLASADVKFFGLPRVHVSI